MKPLGVVSVLRREGVGAEARRKAGGETGRVIGERSVAERVGAEGRLVAAGKGDEAGGVRTGEPGAVQIGLVDRPRVVPLAAAEELDRGGIDAGGDEELDEEGRGFAGVRNEDGVDGSLFDDGGNRRRLFLHRGLVEVVALDGDDPAAGIGGGALQRRLDHRAVGVRRDERGDRLLPLAGGVADDAVDIRLRQEADQIDAGRRGRGVGREGDDRNVGGFGDRSRRRHRLGIERTEDEGRALGDRLGGGGAGAVGGAAIVLDEDRYVRGRELAERKVGGVPHVLGELPGTAGRGKREQHRHADGALAQHLAGHGTRARRSGVQSGRRAGAEQHGNGKGAGRPPCAVRTQSRQAEQSALPSSRKPVPVASRRSERSADKITGNVSKTIAKVVTSRESHPGNRPGMAGRAPGGPLGKASAGVWRLQNPICVLPRSVRSAAVARPLKSTSKSIGAKSGGERPARKASLCPGK